jgi:hypothetical protein
MSFFCSLKPKGKKKKKKKFKKKKGKKEKKEKEEDAINEGVGRNGSLPCVRMGKMETEMDLLGGGSCCQSQLLCSIIFTKEETLIDANSTPRHVRVTS